MIKSLRKKFIAISMLSIFIVLLVIFSALMISNYLSVIDSADARMDMLIDNGGSLLFFDMPSSDPKKFDRSDDKIDIPGGKKKSDVEPDLPFKDRLGRMSDEAPFDTRYFTATFDDEGNISSLETDRIYSISDDTASEMAEYIYSKHRERGFYDNFRFRITTIDRKKMVLFLDCSRELLTLKDFLIVSVLILAISFLSVFGLIVFFSGIVTKPIAESYEKQKQFITDASHELKTPLAIIEANNEVVEMEHGQSEWTGTISKQIRRLSSLTEKLVFLSRIDEESYHPDMENFDISDAILDTVDTYEGVCEVKNKKMTVDVPTGLTCYGNEENIRRMLSLLLDNAVKYSSEGGEIKISAVPKKSKGHLTLTIENPVDNITPGNLDILFERFYRSDTSRSSKTGGHGIGLSVVAAIVRTHKGRIHAESPDGHSIIFTLTI